MRSDVAQTWRTANSLGGGFPNSSKRAAPAYAIDPNRTRPTAIPLSKAHTKLMTAHWTASKTLSTYVEIAWPFLKLYAALHE